MAGSKDLQINIVTKGDVAGVEKVDRAMKGLGDTQKQLGNGDVFGNLGGLFDEYAAKADKAKDALPEGGVPELLAGKGGADAGVKGMGLLFGAAGAGLTALIAVGREYYANNEELQESVGNLKDAMGSLASETISDLIDKMGGGGLAKAIDWVTEKLGGETKAMKEANSSGIDHTNTVKRMKGAHDELTASLKEEEQGWKRVQAMYDAAGKEVDADIERQKKREVNRQKNEELDIEIDPNLSPADKITKTAESRAKSNEAIAELERQQRNNEVDAKSKALQVASDQLAQKQDEIMRQEARLAAQRELEKEQLLKDELERKKGDLASNAVDQTMVMPDEQGAATLRALQLEADQLNKQIEAAEKKLTDQKARADLIRQAAPDLKPSVGDSTDAKGNKLTDEEIVRMRDLKKQEQALKDRIGGAGSDPGLMAGYEDANHTSEQENDLAKELTADENRRNQIRAEQSAKKVDSKGGGNLEKATGELAQEAEAQTSGQIIAADNLEKATAALKDGSTGKELATLADAIKQAKEANVTNLKDLVKVAQDTLAAQKGMRQEIEALKRQVEAEQ